MSTSDIALDTSPPQLLMYWIRERYKILQKKEAGRPPPWSDDPVFQTTYFCNVHRENDKVTRWIRNYYSRYVDHPFFEYNIILSRFLNWPRSLEAMGFLEKHDPSSVLANLEEWAKIGLQVWGGAYLITTHGVKMPKAKYLTENVLGSAFAALESLRTGCRSPWCATAAQALQRVEGIGSFLAGQVVADLKNTSGHPLESAEDWLTFVVPGPGSLRGASWFHYNEPNKVSPANFQKHFDEIVRYTKTHWPEVVPFVCNQDLQNCLCEFDKYMRVRNGTGRSKRKYNGIGGGT